ncbi:hypothetical protein FF2_033577 [Malus domestica]
MWNSAENVFPRSGSFREEGDDEEALRWTVLERLLTYTRIDVGKLEAKDQKLILDGLLAISFQPTEVGRNRKAYQGQNFKELAVKHGTDDACTDIEEEMKKIRETKGQMWLSWWSCMRVSVPIVVAEVRHGRWVRK